MSVHGDAYPYLHTMGPRDWNSMLQYGLEQGHVVGVIGSTDHHSAHPGSYGHGRLGIWAEQLSREGIWNAIRDRRTCALTGDKIRLAFSINGAPMGSIMPPNQERDIHVSVEGGDAIDTIELVYNNQAIKRWNPGCWQSIDSLHQRLKIHLEVGWGERGTDVDWQVELRIVDGALMPVEPRFRGDEVVDSLRRQKQAYSFSDWKTLKNSAVQFSTRAWGNPTTSTASTQGICLEIDAKAETRLAGSINGQKVDLPVSRLLKGPCAGYLGGFLSPAYCFRQAAPQSAYSASVQFSHGPNSPRQDWYYVRVRQKNGQWAWISPIWVRHECL